MVALVTNGYGLRLRTIGPPKAPRPKASAVGLIASISEARSLQPAVCSLYGRVFFAGFFGVVAAALTGRYSIIA